MIFYTAVGLFVVLLVLFWQDLRSTRKALNMGGQEVGLLSKPLVKWLGNKWGVVTAKSVGTVIGVGMLWLAWHDEVWSIPGMVAACAYHGKVVKANWEWVRQWRKTVKAWRGK